MRKLLTILFVIGCFQISFAQTMQDTTFVSWKAVVWLPPNYFINNNADSSIQAIVFTYGVTQAGTAPYSAMKTYGVIAYLLSGWNGGVLLGNGTHYPIIIGLQQNPAYTSNGQMLSRVNAIKSRYKIKTSNFHATGWSAGGDSWKLTATEDAYDSIPPYGTFTYASSFKSLFDFQGVVPDDNAEWYQKVKNFARNGVTGGGKYLGVWGTLESDRQIPRFADSMNAAVSGSGIAFGINSGHNDGAVDRMYGSLTGTPPENFTFGGTTQNVYQWMLRQGDTTINGRPVVNAGNDTAFQLPLDSVTLNGSATDPDGGTIVSYQWEKVSGGTATIQSPTSAVTKVTGLSSGVYVFSLSATDNVGAIGRDSVTITVISAGSPNANAGSDTVIYLNQKRPDTVVLNGNASTGAFTYLWEQIQGTSVSNIQSPTSAFTYGIGLTEGTFKFKLTVDGVSSDTITVTAIDYMNKNKRPCRVGTPQAFTLARTNSTELYRPYLTRDNIVPSLLGGDTLYIQGGEYSGGIEIGDIGGNVGCPIIIAPKDSPVVITNNGYFRMASKDTAVLCYAKVDGTLLRSKGYPYGWVVYNNSATPTKSGIGLTFNWVHDLEIAGININYKEVGIMVKLDAKPQVQGQYDKMLIQNVFIHDNIVKNIDGEGYYIGHTGISGGQSGNPYGAPIRMDTVHIYNNIADSTTWDGIQLSNALNDCKIYNNMVYRYGVKNIGSQQQGIIGGGNIYSIQIYNNFVKNGTGASIGLFGSGTPYLYNNYLDSAKAGTGAESGIYVQKNSVSPESIGALIPTINGNIIGDAENYAVYLVNSVSGGLVSYNYFYGNTNNSVANNSTATVSNNTVKASFPLTVNNISQTSTGYTITITQDTATQTFTNIETMVNWIFSRMIGGSENSQPYPKTRYKRVALAESN